jgi:broad specificity phosphatase PhoE
VSRTIHLVRHAEPAASWGADPDPGLSTLGQQQAQAFAASFGGPATLWTSPMARCRETAGPLAARLRQVPEIVPAVSEIPTPHGLSDARGWLMDVLRGHWPDQAATIQSWRESVVTAVSDASVDGPPLVIFTHFIAINAVVSAITGDSRVTVFQPGHASVTTLVLEDGRLRLVSTGAEQAIVLT